MKGLAIVFRREFRDTLLSRQYLIYVVLLFTPVGIMAWVDRVLYGNPGALIRLSAAYPEPITAVTPAIALMLFGCGTVSIPILIGIIHAGNSVAGDRARGMLALMSTKPISRWEIVAGKYLAFLAAFLPLVLVTIVVMYVLIGLMGIGWATAKVFWGYAFLLLILTLVYSSVAILISSVVRRPLEAILGTLILFTLWFTFDFVMGYLPGSIADTLGLFSLGFHANTSSAFISGGEAIFRMMHVVGATVASGEFIRSLSILLALVTVPTTASLFLVARRDAYAS